ncbi:MAG: TatD family hydrolase [Clostridia bacterium]|nr:TatD family hydrolase [Clostridia bacterium]
MIIDSHSHYDDTRFDGDREELLLGLKNQNIEKIINVGYNLESSKMAVKLANTYDFCYAAVGFHPSDAKDFTENEARKLIELTKDPKVVCWGEIGLDYHYDNINKEQQKAVFLHQMEIAKELKIPVAIHTRDAMADTIEIVKKCQTPGVFHCYSGSLEIAKELVKLGYYISFSGTVTYKNAKNVKEVAKWIPSDKYLIETDCPYLSPEPLRGTRNDSSNLKYTAQHIAELRNVSVEQVVRETNGNTKRLFGIV